MKQVRVGLLLYLLFYCFCPSLARSEDLSQNPSWLRLLHMKPSFPLGHLKSEVDNPQFFFAQDGAKNPANELQASVQAFKKEPKLQCTFPARFQFLNQKLTLKLPTVPCIELDEFLRRLSGDAMSLVFSSAYPNSPPSMFGHTFLRIHRNGREVLLDESINYAAQASPDENTILFTVFGLM